MQNELNQAIAHLYAAHDDFRRGAIKSLEHAQKREEAISQALRAMVVLCGAELAESSYQVTSRGEYPLTTPTDGTSHKRSMTEELTGFVNQHHPRTGAAHTAILDSAQSTWCYLNHFEVEKMVVAFHKSLQNSQ